ncbi:hypothetical protein [Paraburkholderia strydomiana]|uniref:hypothetical protein n=1 Tax=Paraburkholderia strydomiana TaxID=1245417 RepID=UPI001BE7CE13|nr:hypothetical protein [Paraburkholderia strydomiana]MBT2789182.1 hypothetical protein [Paraburkholderia strydomiana]
MSAATRADVFPPAVNPPAKKTPPKDAPPMTIEEFCKRYALSRSHYYEMKQQGRTPAELRVGRKALITADSARAWERRISLEHKATRATQAKG